ncbi:MAG: radical SAM protein [Spirochaetales bacterium]|nr:radical SAM protein [Spirochaetales bacterium]
MSGVLLIQPTEFFSGISSLKNIVPIHLLLLATPLRQENIPVHFLLLLNEIPGIPQDMRELVIYFKKLVKNFQEYDNIKFAGISCYSSDFFVPSFIIAHAIREALPEVTIMIGGYGVNTCVDDFIFEGAPFDYVFAGEADIELTRMIKKLINSPKGTRLPGKNGKPVLIQCPEIQDLDSLPLIDWSLLEKTEIIKFPLIIIPYYASRGCPFKCKYCCDLSNLSELGYHKKWRPRSIANILKELQNMKKMFDSKQISLYIQDPIFGLNRKWKLELVESLIDMTKKWEDCTYWIQERVETISEEIVRLYSKLDIMITLGFESGSPKMLTLMNKTRRPDLYLEKMIENRNLFEKYQMYYCLNVMFGYPGETKKEILESQKYISELFRESKYGLLWVLKYQFFPGSFIFQNAGAKEFEDMEVLFPDWYKRMGNSIILPGLNSSSKELGNIESFKCIRDWVMPLYEGIAGRLSPSPFGKISYNFGKNVFLKQFMLEWKHRPEYIEMIEEVLKTYSPELLPVGKDFPHFIKNAANDPDTHLKAMRKVALKFRNLTL